MTPSAPALASARTCSAGSPRSRRRRARARRRERRARAGPRRRAGSSGAGHADERDAVQEAAGAVRDHCAARRWRRRRDEVDDGEPGIAGDGLERRALVGREIRHDDAGRAGIGEPLRSLAPVAATDDLVRVAHRHERDARAGESAICRTSSIELSNVAPALSAADDARWSVAPSASGSEYGSPTSSTSAPSSMQARAAWRLVS